MNTFTNASMPLKLFGVVLALALVAVAALLVTPTSAQSLDNTYPNPQPCGEGAAKANQPEPHEVTIGHFALFDSYWRVTARNQRDDAPNAGVLHTNLCPPKMTQGDGDDATEVLTRSISNIDIGEAIMHVLDKHKVDVVATNAEATDGQLSLEEYPEVRKALGLLGPNDELLPVPEGTQVWWLKLDDPDTQDDPNTQEKENDETSDLSLGFSTALFDHKYWLTSAHTDEDGNAQPMPMRYKFEVERYQGENPAEVPHFLAYEAPESSNAKQMAVWNSIRPDIDDDDMTLDPGEYRALQWIFTKAGTYELSVHLQGFVRKTKLTANPNHPDYVENWRPISGKVAETGEVKQYTIQVGSELVEMEPPLFGVNLSVAENSPGGVKIGDPIPVYESEAETLKYSLGGDGHANFKAVAVTDPRGAARHAVQIVVADGASLDYETKASYNLTLSVTDNVNHENHPDDTVDDTLAVRIDLEDQSPGVDLQVDRGVLPVGETVNFIARYEPTPERRDQAFTYQWAERTIEGGEVKWHAIDAGVAPSSPTWSVSQSSSMSKTYRVSVVLVVGDDPKPTFVDSSGVEIRWVSN